MRAKGASADRVERRRGQNATGVVETRQEGEQRRGAAQDQTRNRGHSLTEAQEQTKTRAAAAKHTLGEGSTGLEEGRPPEQ